MAVETLRPNAVGSNTNLAQQPGAGDNYDKVDEAEPDDGTTYVKRNVLSYAVDTYGLPDHSVGSGTINSVKVRCNCEYDPTQSSPVYVKPAIETYGTVYYGTEQLITNIWDPEIYYDHTWTENPDTTDPWTWAEIDALEAGVALKGHSNKTTIEARCTQVYVEIEYTAGGPTYYHGLKVQGEGELALCDAGSHPLRIRKGGTTYGIELVAIDDPNASRVRIKTPTGINSIRKYT